MANCSYCGCYVSASAKFCPSCGGRMGGEAATKPLVQTPEVWYAQSENPDPEPQPEEYHQPGPGLRSTYARAAQVLAARPVRLWGVSMLCSLLVVLSGTLAVIPIIALPIAFALYVGMEAIYMEALYGAEPTSPQLFKGFTRGSFLRYAAGMGWMSLWVLIWGLIPFAGVVLAVVKAYSYRFVPYIMLSDPEVDAFEALSRSKEMTRGFRMKMFLADILPGAVLLAAVLILVLLSNIDYIGFIFALLLVAVLAAAVAFLPLFLGLVRAGFYDEIEKML